jgi:hypothetical protein
VPKEQEQSEGDRETTPDEPGEGDLPEGHIAGVKGNDLVNLRSGPDVNYDKAAGLTSGNPVQLLGSLKPGEFYLDLLGISFPSAYSGFFLPGCAVEHSGLVAI